MPQRPRTQRPSTSPGDRHERQARLALPEGAPRPAVRGKHLYVAGRKLPVRGVTYGTFRTNNGNASFPTAAQVADDFAEMAANGINAVRTYTVPAPDLLDLAWQHGLRVLVGLPWEQHVAFLDDVRRARSIEYRIREGVAACAGHPAVLAYAVGNEIPASIVRWHGRRPVERFLGRLIRAAKETDPGSVVTYVNYPSTEYLDIPLADLVCFNVFLESEVAFRRYVARLQNVAGNRPLLLTELGLDSRRHGEHGQASVVGAQLRMAYGLGCAGAFVFAWTDEWHRGGHDVLDWDFGLVDRERRPKPALSTVRTVFAELASPADDQQPAFTVVVCSYNGERWLGGCLDALRELDYPNYEVVVVDDGSTDTTAEIARRYPEVKLVSTPNAGLSAARNIGMTRASGDIVAYVDDDARPDPHWLTELARVFADTSHAAVGGPNIAPPGGGAVADCVANSPGGPIHVMLSDHEAEHVPGCNMAIRKAALQTLGGFDPAFRIAGDDVDLCWRLQERGFTVGFSPGAVVWHHPRDSVRGYLRQQLEYGKAEALLERKWPNRYNRAGHLSWAGRVYGGSLLRRRERIRYGRWGGGLFQSVYQPAPGLFSSLPVMPEWYLVLAVLTVVAALGVVWQPLLLALPLLALAAGVTAFHAVHAGLRATFSHRARSRRMLYGLRALTAALHLLQPLARLCGRLRYGLTPWRRCCPPTLAPPRARTTSLWSEEWRSNEVRLGQLERVLRRDCPAVRHGGEYDRWDLEVRGGMLGVARVRMAVEEHGFGRQLVRFRSWPIPSRAAVVLSLLLGGLAAGAATDAALPAAAVLGGLTAAFAAACLRDCASATGTLLRGIARHADENAADSALEPRAGRAREEEAPPREARPPEVERLLRARAPVPRFAQQPDKPALSREAQQ